MIILSCSSCIYKCNCFSIHNPFLITFISSKLFSVSRALSEVSKYGFFSGPYFRVLGMNTGKYGPEKTACLVTFHAVA